MFINAKDRKRYFLDPNLPPAERIHTLCTHYGIREYILHNDLSISCLSVHYADWSPNQLPLRFNLIRGNCIIEPPWLRVLALSSLQGAPRLVEGDFHCSALRLRSLDGLANTVIHGDFSFEGPLLSLQHFPRVHGTVSLRYAPVAPLYDTFIRHPDRIARFNALGIIQERLGYGYIRHSALNTFLREHSEDPISLGSLRRFTNRHGGHYTAL
jgi:hypothetical protein